MTPWSKATVCLRTIEILVGQVLEKRSPGSLVRTISINYTTANTRQIMTTYLPFHWVASQRYSAGAAHIVWRWHKHPRKSSKVNSVPFSQTSAQHNSHDMIRSCHWSGSEDQLVFSVYLCRTLESEDLRKRYISPPVPGKDRPLVYPETGQPWIGRRIDYILYRENSVSKHCRTVCVRVRFSSFLNTVFSLFGSSRRLCRRGTYCFSRNYF